VAHWLAYLTTLQPRSVVKLFGGVDRTARSVRYSFELETIEKRLEQRLVRYRPILYVHVYILGYILRPFGGRVGPPWALATHGPRGYFYALVTQLPISDMRSTVICVRLLSCLCLVDSEAKKACSTQADTNQRRLYHCTATLYMYSASRAYHSALY